MTFYSRNRQVSNTPRRYEAIQGGVFSKEERYKSRSNYLHHTITTSDGDFAASGVDIYMMPPSNVANAVAAKAYDRFLDKMRSGSSASLGASIAEGRSSLEMIARRASMLRNAYKSVRRGDIIGAARLLGIPPDSKRLRKLTGSRKPGKVSKKHYASASWLELYFGWLPLLGDIHDATEVLSKPVFGQVKVVSSASQSYARTLAGYPEGNSAGKYGVRYEGVIRVSNPNAFLATKMGLVNPAAIAWELVPFSFVIDWFINISQYLESFTDFVGTDFLGGSMSKKIKSSGYIKTSRQSMTLLSQQRSVLGAIPRPRLFLQSPLGGPARAATQIALLIQLFLKP